MKTIISEISQISGSKTVKGEKLKLKIKEIEDNLSTRGLKSPNFTYSSCTRYRRLDKITRPYTTGERDASHVEKKNAMRGRIFQPHLHLIMEIWDHKSCLEREKARESERN